MADIRDSPYFQGVISGSSIAAIITAIVLAPSWWDLFLLALVARILWMDYQRGFFGGSRDA